MNPWQAKLIDMEFWFSYKCILSKINPNGSKFYLIRHGDKEKLQYLLFCLATNRQN